MDCLVDALVVSVLLVRLDLRGRSSVEEAIRRGLCFVVPLRMVGQSSALWGSLLQQFRTARV